MKRSEQIILHGVQSAKLGMAMIAFSNLLLIVPALSSIRFNK
ncbi:MAG: hypothetical protein ACN4GF_09040 [Lentimonas sp.]